MIDLREEHSTAYIIAEVNGQQATEALAHAEMQARTLEIQAATQAEAEQRQRALVATLETPTFAAADGVLGDFSSRRRGRPAASNPAGGR
jgi:hypothetical protein